MSLHTIDKDIRLNFVDGSRTRFKMRFLQPGVVSYAEMADGGIELLEKSTIDAACDSFIGCPLQITHPNPKAHGKVDKVYFNSEDGWYWAEGTVETDEARVAIDKGWKPSCGYRVNKIGPGGTWHNVKYKSEIQQITFDHVALVTKPRYEDADVRLNSMKNNVIKWIKQLVMRENASVPAETNVELAGDSEVEVNGKSVPLSVLISTYARANEGVEPKAEDVPAVLVKEEMPVKKEEKPVVSLCEDDKSKEGGKGGPAKDVQPGGETTDNGSKLTPGEGTVSSLPLTDSPEKEAASKSADGKDEVKVEKIVINTAPVNTRNIIDTPIVQVPKAERVLDDKAQGLKHFNDLATAKDRFNEAIKGQSVDSSSKERQLELGRLLF